jgi:hypothetical protein
MNETMLTLARELLDNPEQVCDRLLLAVQKHERLVAQANDRVERVIHMACEAIEEETAKDAPASTLLSLHVEFHETLDDAKDLYWREHVRLAVLQVMAGIMADLTGLVAKMEADHPVEMAAARSALIKMRGSILDYARAISTLPDLGGN